jgi:hypothetical protein
MTPDLPKGSNGNKPLNPTKPTVAKPNPAKPGPAKPAPTKLAPSKGTASRSVAEATAKVPIPKPPPLFRRADWICFGITTLVMFLSYMYTLAPDLTLEDSGELATGSFYLGVPHPPGYPVWTIYTWFFAVLLPISNIAYRVAVSSAVAGALTCGVVAMMVSRGSSMLMEGISEFRDIAKTWENEICVVTGFVAGALIGFDGFMWSQAVIVEVYTLTALSLVGVFVFLFRWVYAPHQHRYLYLAWFTFGIACCNHQSLMVCALGIAVLIAAVQPRLGRDIFLGGFGLAVVGLFFNQLGSLETLNGNTPLLVIYCLIAAGCLVAWVWQSVQAKGVGPAAPWMWGFLLLAMILALMKPQSWDNSDAKLAVAVLGLLAVVMAVVMSILKREHSFNWTLFCAGAFILGAALYLFLPVASMANPPMNWGYPRTVAGFIHALTRGQYERIHPTTGTGQGPELVWSFLTRYTGQLKMLADGTMEELNPLYLLLLPLAMLAFLWLRKSRDPENVWLRPGVFCAAACTGLCALIVAFKMGGEEGHSARPGLGSTMVTVATVMLAGCAVVCGVWALVCVLRCLQARERAWLIGLLAFWVLLGPFLMMLFNPSPDRQSLSLIKVFFTPSHMIVAMALAYSLTLVLAALATAYEQLRAKTLVAAAVLAALALYGMFNTFEHNASFLEHSVYYLPRSAAVLGLVVAVASVLALFVFVRKAPVGTLLVVFAFMPGHSILGHWSENEQRGHRFGFWFGHDMFTPPFQDKNGQPLYPEMAKDTVLFGGTDPGRFCPTYMIFCESFIPPEKRYDPKFDRRDVYIITQNALADGTYLNYIRGHYFRSAEVDPPFFSECFRGEQERTLNYKTNLLARLMLPLDHLFLGLGDSIEKDRRAGSSLFKESDFLDLAAFTRKLKDGGAPEGLSKYLYDHLKPETQELTKGATDARLAKALAQDLNRLMNGEYEAYCELPELRLEMSSLTNQLAALRDQGQAESRASRRIAGRLDELQKKLAADLSLVPFYEPARFRGAKLSDYVKRFVAQQQALTEQRVTSPQHPYLHARIRLSRLLLEEAYPGLIAKSQGGLYPDMEIYTPSNDDSQRCFQDYMADAQKRMEHDRQHPNEPPQIKPGEDVRVVGGRVQVSGQVAVMAINGLLTKVIFEHNPTNEFYVEESFPLDWMFPHLTPFGIIMKINRQPLPSLPDDVFIRDHEFWSQYSGRLIGNWITYDTTITNICAWAEQVYVRHDYTGFTGDRRFIRDDDAQKAFSKLRSSIGGMYAWRLGRDCGPEYRPKSEAELNKLLREVEFAFKQAYAFCPYSPEALYRYVNVLTLQGRFDEARLMAATSKKLDPDNVNLDNLIKQLENMRKGPPPPPVPTVNPGQVAALEAEFRAHPSNLNNAMYLASLLAPSNPERVRQIADVVLTNSPNDPTAARFVWSVFSQLRDPKLEMALQNLARLEPTPENWLELAALKAALNKQSEALAAVSVCLRTNAGRAPTDPQGSNITFLLKTDPRFQPLRAMPLFQKMVPSNLATPLLQNPPTSPPPRTIILTNR